MATTAQVIEVLQKMAAVIEENKDYLTELDMPIGDSDHGINLNRGFQAVLEKLPTVAGKDVGTILKTVGMTLVSTVGGASGPLYGTAFMKAAMVGNKKMEVTPEEFFQMLKAAIDGVMMRGRSTVGEATMLDAMVPAYEAMTVAYQSESQIKAALAAGIQAARDGVEKTKGMIATKGRASYLGERGIGHQDPGATSFTLLLEAIAQTLA